MKLLLDTHVVLWWVDGNPRLHGHWAETILRPTSDVFVSIATWWEIVLKVRTGKLKADLAEIKAALDEDRFQWLAISPDHLKTLLSLPPHHRDLFDQLLIAQAISEGATLVSDDRAFRQYPVELL